MQEIIQYFESLEARLATTEERLAASETRIAELEAELTELKNRPLPEPEVVEKVVEKIVEVEKPVEVIKEVVVEKPVEVIKEVAVEPEPEIILEPEPEVIPETEPEKKPTATPELFPEEPVAPKAAIYGKPVDDIRQAISLGDRFLYQRELFGQNAELMQRTLNELNGLGSFEDAIEYIQSHFEWDTESNSYQQFLVTLHRRFG